LIIVIIEKCEKSRSKEAIQLAYLKERLFYDFFKFLKYSQTHSTPQSQTKNSGRKVFRDILNITFKKTSFLWRILFVQKTFKVSFEISFLKKKKFSVFWPYNCQIFSFDFASLMRKIWRTLDLKFAKLGNVLKFETAVFAQNLFLEIIHILRIKNRELFFRRTIYFYLLQVAHT
jgi:hypothetical protein